MKGIAFCLSLLLAFSASARSLEEGLCGPSSVPVAQMQNSEKLCRSFSRAMEALPATMTGDARAMLTPENLALMGLLTTTWLGSQGIPVVGQAVDAAMFALGVSLLVGQSAELVHCVWTYGNRSISARNMADLNEAATALARAVSMVGINVVVFILTKKALAKLPRGPTDPPAEYALPQGTRVADLATVQAPSTSTAPAVMMAGGPGRRDSGSDRIRPAKKPDRHAFENWIRRARRRQPIETPEKAAAFQQKYAGAEEILVEGGGVQVWADGVRVSDSYLVDAKFIDKPGVSPFIKESTCPDAVREVIRAKEVQQFLRYAEVISDPLTPAVGLEVITNDARAIPFFEELLRELGIPGRVITPP